MEDAQQGIIAKLRILSMDVVMATTDGSDRWCPPLHLSGAGTLVLCLHVSNADIFAAQDFFPPLVYCDLACVHLSLLLHHIICCSSLLCNTCSKAKHAVMKQDTIAAAATAGAARAFSWSIHDLCTPVAGCL